MARWEGGRALVLSHADSCTGRANQTVRLSVDGGKSFPFAQLIDAASGYSTAQVRKTSSWPRRSWANFSLL